MSRIEASLFHGLLAAETCFQCVVISSWLGPLTQYHARGCVGESATLSLSATKPDQSAIPLLFNIRPRCHSTHSSLTKVRCIYFRAPTRAPDITTCVDLPCEIIVDSGSGGGGGYSKSSIPAVCPAAIRPAIKPSPTSSSLPVVIPLELCQPQYCISETGVSGCKLECGFCISSLAHSFVVGRRRSLDRAVGRFAYLH